ncbi:MAG: hypothetical protein NC247_14530 [Ruminococcus flavefaciens]|nr:hypothetical protein [Ruminococcus flavefaciens]MCM1486740.1 hypothetical protein [Bacillota bacterium]
MKLKKKFAAEFYAKILGFFMSFSASKKLVDTDTENSGKKKKETQKENDKGE